MLLAYTPPVLSPGAIAAIATSVVSVTTLLIVIWRIGNWTGRVETKLNEVHERIDSHMDSEDRTIEAMAKAHSELVSSVAKIAEAQAYVAGRLGLHGD